MKSTTWSPIPNGEALVAGRFEAGPDWRTWRPHGNADWEVLVSERGRGRFVHAGGELDVEPGRVILLRPGVPHDHGPAPGTRLWRVSWVHFQARDEWLDLLEWPEIAPGLMAIDLPDAQDHQRILALVDEINVAQRLSDRNRRRLTASLLEQTLLRLDARNPYADGARDPRIATVVEALSRGAERSREDLARSVGLSPSRLSHLFRREMGLSLPAFRERLRLERAALLLDGTDQTIAAVAQACGYEEPFYFSNRFRQAKGMSPSAWRVRPNRHAYTGEEPSASGWSGRVKPGT